MADLFLCTTRQIGTETIQTIQARELYTYLEIVGDYNRWITRAIKRANLIENIDFIVYYELAENHKVGRPPIEHHLSFDTAKHIAMMSSASKGHEVRAWFIQKEKELATHQQGALGHYPELRAIVELVQSTAEARLLAEAAKIEAAQANANATRALETQLFYTVAEYVYSNKLQQQLPPNSYRACSDHLRLFSMDRGIPFRRIPVGGQRWEEEYAFHVNVYGEALAPWLRRRFAQTQLRVVPSDDAHATP